MTACANFIPLPLRRQAKISLIERIDTSTEIIHEGFHRRIWVSLVQKRRLVGLIEFQLRHLILDRLEVNQTVKSANTGGLDLQTTLSHAHGKSERFKLQFSF